MQGLFEILSATRTSSGRACSRGRRLFIAFTIRGEKIRVISARDMSKKERSIYEQINSS
jgi:uncharacterized DUF497 family protein